MCKKSVYYIILFYFFVGTQLIYLKNAYVVRTFELNNGVMWLTSAKNCEFINSVMDNYSVIDMCFQ